MKVLLDTDVLIDIALNREPFVVHSAKLLDAVQECSIDGFIWTSGYYANTVSEYSNAEGIKKYIANQASYQKVLVQQLTFEL